jgi:predicted transposase YdaD
LYFDLVLAALSAAAREELQAMDPAKYEYQSEFAKRCVAKGRAEGRVEGKAEGRAALLTRQLTLRFGPLPADAVATLGAASIEELDAIGERLLVAQTLNEALRHR